MNKFLFFLIILAACTSESQQTAMEDKLHVQPVKLHGIYSLTTGNVSIEIDTAAGARVSSLKINGHEMLYTSRDSNNNNWGSTFWPSPQALWGWPPPAVLDHQPYTAIPNKGNIEFESQVSEHPALSFSKIFSAHPEDTSIQITYSITNHADTTLFTSAWEITRVPAGGLLFYPTGSDKPKGDLSQLLKDTISVTWLRYDSTRIPSGIPKLFADGSEGWIAFVNSTHQLFIKKFSDSEITSKAPDPENEIELYMNPNKAYTEIEEQGPYTKLNPKQALQWKVTWYVRNLPHGLPTGIGSQQLLDYVRKVVK